MTSRTNERGGVKVHAVLLAILLYQCTSVSGNPVAQWLNSLPAGSQYHPIVEHFINCYKTVSTQSNNDIGFMKCLTLINSMLKTDLPDKTPSFNNLFQPPADLNVPKAVPPTRKSIKAPEPPRNLPDNSYVTATVPNSKILLHELKKLWDGVKDNPRVSTNRQIVEKLNRMRAILQQNPTQQNIMNLITDLRNHLNYDEDETAIFRNNALPPSDSKKPTSTPIAESTHPRKIMKPKPTPVTVPSTETSNEDDELTFRANFVPESTSVATEPSTNKIDKPDSPIFRTQLKSIKPNEIIEKTNDFTTPATDSPSTNLYKYKAPERSDKSVKILANPGKIKQTPSEPVQTKTSPKTETIDISQRLNIEKSTTENPEKFTKTVRNNFLQNNLEKQAEISDGGDEELSLRTGVSWPQVHAVEELVNTDIYSPHLAPQLQNFVPVSHPFYPYPSFSPPHYSPHSYMVPVRPEDDAHMALAGVPTPNHFYKCN